MKNKQEMFGRSVKKVKLLLFLSFVCISSALLANDLAYAQQTLFTFSMNGVKIQAVFDRIEAESEFVFFYSDKVINPKEVVSVTANNETVTQILDKLLAGYGVDYTVNNRQITLTKKDEVSPQQTKKRHEVRGIVKDEVGVPVIGATVMVKGTTTGVVTDVDGLYTIMVPSDEAVLRVSYVGYVTQEIKVDGRSTIAITLKEDSKMLEDVVVIGYGQQKKSGVVSSVNSVSAKEIKAPTRNLTNNLAGQIAGLIAIQRNGEPGNDNAEFWIRGTSSFAGGTNPLVLVDGAPRNMQDIEPDEIESFTVLKDAAATAVYGAEGANGVILITSKRGKAEKPRISFRGEFGMATPTRMPELVGAVDHMTMYNEARKNDGLPQFYSDELIAHYANHDDPDLYPDTDWFDLLEDHTFNQRVTLNVRGGSGKARYFVSGAYYHEEGIFKNNSMEDYSCNIGLSRYNLRSNVDIDITNSTLLSVDLSGQYSMKNEPGTSASTIFDKIGITPPHLIPMRYSDGTAALPPDAGANRTNPYLLLTESGYSKRWTTSIQSTIKLEQKLDFITKGLKWMGRVSFDSYSNYSMTRSKTFSGFYATGRDENGSLIFDQVKKGNESLSDPDESSSGDKKIYIETQLNYNRLFADKHLVNGMLLYMQKEQQYHNDALAHRKQSIVGRMSYSFDERYFIEGSFGYTGSEMFADKHRFGFFPAVGIAYLISNEPFMPSGFTEVVNKLKIRASIGRTGNDNTGGSRFLYRELLKTDAGGYNIGIGKDKAMNDAGKGIVESRFAAPLLGWEIENKRNVGIDIGLFGNKIDLQVDYFNNLRTDILLQRRTIPSITGFREAPWENYGKVRNQGMDASLVMTEKFGDVKLTFRGNLTFARNKILEYDEVPQKHPWMNVTGTSLGDWNLYIAEGLYEFEDFDVVIKEDGTKEYNLKEGLPVSTLGGVVGPGDIKYKDLNEDGVIDSNDQTRYAADPKNPELVYGFGLNVDYKGFYASVFFQGAGKTSTVLGQGDGPAFHPFAWGPEISGFRSYALDRWTEENPSQNVFFPRIHSSSHFHDRAASTWWLRDASFLRLKNIELGYNFPTSIAQKMAMQSARIYLMGYNIAVWDHIKLWDPELGNKNDGMAYPLSRTFTLGVEFTF